MSVGSSCGQRVDLRALLDIGGFGLPGVCGSVHSTAIQNIALNILPAAFLLSSLVLSSVAFSPSSSPTRVACRGELDFYLWFDDLCFIFICPSRVTAR